MTSAAIESSGTYSTAPVSWRGAVVRGSSSTSGRKRYLRFTTTFFLTAPMATGAGGAAGFGGALFSSFLGSALAIGRDGTEEGRAERAGREESAGRAAAGRAGRAKAEAEFDEAAVVARVLATYAAGRT